MVKPHPKIAKPPMRWEKARNFSAENLRSAHSLLKNMPTMEAMGKALRMSACSEIMARNNLGRCPDIPARNWGGSDAENPKLGKYPKIKGSQAPQMKNSSTIMRNNLKRIPEFMDWV